MCVNQVDFSFSKTTEPEQLGKEHKRQQIWVNISKYSARPKASSAQSSCKNLGGTISTFSDKMKWIRIISHLRISFFESRHFICGKGRTEKCSCRSLWFSQKWTTVIKNQNNKQLSRESSDERWKKEGLMRRCNLRILWIPKKPASSYLTVAPVGKKATDWHLSSSLAIV